MLKFRGSNILSVSQFDIDDVERIFSVAKQMEKYSKREKYTTVLNGAILSNLFFEPSTRTRISFGCAFNRLGGSTNDTVGFEFSSITKGESIYDTARVVSGYVDVMVVRHPEEGSVAKFAESSIVPIINGGDGIGEHPTQALLDLYTIFKEKGSVFNRLNNLNIAMIGDLKNGRTVHSLAKLLSMFNNITFTLISPGALQMPKKIADLVSARGHKIIVSESLQDGIKDADIIYTTRIQEERFESKNEYNKYRGIFKLNNENYSNWNKNKAIIMHPLPRDSREGSNEIDTDLNHHTNLAIFRQTDNGIPIRMALFALVLGVVDKVDEHQCRVAWTVPANFRTEANNDIL